MIVDDYLLLNAASSWTELIRDLSSAANRNPLELQQQLIK